MSATDKASTKITLPSEREIVITRAFDAPRALVFDAWTKPALLKRWWGAPGWSLPVCEIDLRVGGAWRYVMRNERGIEMTLRGVYREIVRPERLVNTQLMEGCEGQGESEAVCTMVLAERAGGTKQMHTTMTSTARYPSREVRDSVLKHGTTEEGMEAVFSRLARVLTENAAQSSRL